MNPNDHQQPPRGSPAAWGIAVLRWAQGGLIAACLAALVVACGGGVGSGGTGGFASGPISGFGSVIVNAVRFDDTLAVVVDGDGATRTREDLRLGMTVDVDSGAITTTLTGQTASAHRIAFDSALRGSVTLVDKGNSAFNLLGQRVRVDATTVFDERLVNALNGLAVGSMLEVYAVFDAASGSYRATRVEPASTSASLLLRGPIAQLDATAKTLRVGTTSYAYGTATGVPADLAAGQFVRLGLATDGEASWRVLAFGTALRSLPDAEEAKLEGLISAFTSATAFSINGRPVDASAASFPDGRSGLALGVRVEVEGSLRNGVLIAKEVEIQSDDDERDEGFELEGSITSVAADFSSFVLRGQTVSTQRPGLIYSDGKASDLKVGVKVHVKGVLSADGQRIEATRIEFDD